MGGFQGATVHDAFNFLTVLCIFPVEVATGVLGMVSDSLAEVVLGADLQKWDSPVKILTKPATKHFIGINKDLIKEIAKGCQPCKQTDDGLCMHDVKDGDSYTKGTMECNDSFCQDVKKVDDEKFYFCISEEDWTQKHMVEERVVKSGFAHDMGDVVGSTVVLVIALFFLCFALYWIVRILHYLVLSSGRRVGENGEQTTFMKITQKVLGMHPILSIIYGMLMTITVQSSSIITSTLTPLVALDIITLEQMLPLTLGANIGTTCTAFIASVVSGSQDAIQVSICHLLFIGVAFVAVPILLYFASLVLDFGIPGVIANLVLDVIIVGGAFAMIKNFVKIYSAVTGKAPPESEPSGESATAKANGEVEPAATAV